MEEKIKKRIEELTAARAAYATEAHKQLFGYDVAIAELSALLKVEEEKQPEPTPEVT